jgi:hypothetical protein
MTVEESGHDGLIREVDHSCASGYSEPGPDGLNLSSFDNDHLINQGGSRLWINQLASLYCRHLGMRDDRQEDQ